MLQRNIHMAVHDAHGCCSRMGEAGCSDAVVVCTSQRVVALHASLEVLMSIKEMRTPLVRVQDILLARHSHLLKLGPNCVQTQELIDCSIDEGHLLNYLSDYC